MGTRDLINDRLGWRLEVLRAKLNPTQVEFQNHGIPIVLGAVADCRTCTQRFCISWDSITNG